jgi:hypothetical protein
MHGEFVCGEFARRMRGGSSPIQTADSERWEKGRLPGGSVGEMRNKQEIEGLFSSCYRR